MNPSEEWLSEQAMCSHGERRKNCILCLCPNVMTSKELNAAKKAWLDAMEAQRPNFIKIAQEVIEQSSGKSLKPYRQAKPRGPNKWEAEYEIELKARLHSSEIIWYGFEAITLRLADRTTYTPDFVVMYPDRSIEVVEIKGFLREDANVKFKVAAELFPFVFLMLRKKKVSEGGGWEYMRSLDGYRKFANAK